MHPGKLFEWETLRKEIVVVDIDVNVDEFEMTVVKLEREFDEGILTHSSTTVLITSRNHLMGLVYTVCIKLKHRQEIVSYQLRGLALFLFVEF